MSGAWNTEYGRRRVRREPPTLDEAVAAAQGLTDDMKQQVELAASLMGIAPDASVEAAVRKARTRSQTQSTVTSKGRSGMQRAVVVERKVARRPGTVKRFGF